MWKSRYKNKFKTSNPRLIITAVQSFPNIVDTVEKAIKDYKVKELQADPMLLEIESLYALEHGRDFIPLYFEDDVPKLKKLPMLPVKSMFWCIGYVNKAHIRVNEYSSRREFPDSKTFRNLLEYSIANLGGNAWEFLFENCVDQYVHEQTKDWSDVQKSRRFRLICNTSLHFLTSTREYRPDMNNCTEFLDKMYTRDIYEFIFNEYK